VCGYVREITRGVGGFRGLDDPHVVEWDRKAEGVRADVEEHGDGRYPSPGWLRRLMPPRRSCHRYFGSKSGLYLEVVRAAIDEPAARQKTASFSSPR
jgi:hypothetical protein